MKKIIYAFVVLTLLSSLKVQAQLPNIQRLLDSFALRQFYNAAGGPSWANNAGWATPGTPINTWFGVTVTGNRVTAINLPGNNLTGTLSPATLVLNALRTFVISDNSLGGNANTVSAFLAGKTQLSVLNLRNNNFTGALQPAIMNNLPGLLYLDIAGNSFTGAPPALTASVNIGEIFLTNNSFSGSIPASYGGFTSLTDLFLDSNQLNSGIEGLASSLSLRNLNLSANQFTGPIPSALGNVISLQTLWLNNNGFSGPIPSELGSLSVLQILGLNHNALTGTIPSTFGGLALLQRLNFRDNMIEGPLPAFLTTLPNLNFLGLINNYFTFAGLEPLIGAIATVEYQDQKLVTLKYNPNNGNLSVDAGGTPANNTYTWYQVGNATPVATKTANPAYQPTVSGNYYVEVTNSVATALILRSKPKAVTVSGAVSSTASIYPNPARNITTLSFKMDGNSVVKVSDRNGRVMSTSTVSNAANGSQVKLDVTRYNPGIYYVSITNGKEVQSVQLNKQ